MNRRNKQIVWTGTLLLMLALTALQCVYILTPSVLVGVTLKMVSIAYAFLMVAIPAAVWVTIREVR